MTALSHQTVRLARGRHASRHTGVCVMELASMLAHEPFSDRARCISPTIGAFLRTYNDGLDDERRQDLYPVASAIVAWAARTALDAGAHEAALKLVDDLVALSATPSRWPRAFDPARVLSEHARV